MEKQKLSNLYPTATRGNLKVDSTYMGKAAKKPLFRVRDRSPGTIIAMGAILAAAVGFCILAMTYWFLS